MGIYMHKYFVYPINSLDKDTNYIQKYNLIDLNTVNFNQYSSFEKQNECCKLDLQKSLKEINNDIEEILYYDYYLEDNIHKKKNLLKGFILDFKISIKSL